MISYQGAKAAIVAFQEARHGNVAGETEVANRANICEQCPMRRRNGVAIRVALGAIHATRILKNRVPDAISEFRCGVCHCPLANLLPAKGEHLHTDSPEEAAKRAKEAPNCWLPAAKAAAP